MKATPLLDCTSAEDAMTSVARIVGVSVDELRRRLRAYDFRAHYDRAGHLDYRDSVWDEVAQDCATRSSYDGDALWFHATRVPRDTPFHEQGLLPSASCIDGIHELVGGIVRELSITQRGKPSSSYLTKLEKLMPSEGPFAFLIREHGRSAKEFLKAPELVRDIAEALAGDAAHRVLEVYRARTVPCLVVFRTHAIHLKDLKGALAYCHNAVTAPDEPWGEHVCVNLGGRAVPVERVEWLGEHAAPR